MNRHLLGVCAIAALGLAVLPGAAVAQQKSMKDQMVGTWTLLLNDYVKADGTHVPAFGPKRRTHASNFSLCSRWTSFAKTGMVSIPNWRKDSATSADDGSGRS